MHNKLSSFSVLKQECYVLNLSADTMCIIKDKGDCEKLIDHTERVMFGREHT